MSADLEPDVNVGAGSGLRRRQLVAALAVTFVADQLTKVLAVEFVADDPPSWGPLRLDLIRNAGGPFGLASGATMLWTALGLVAVVALVAVVRSDQIPGAYAITIGVIAGGAFGNLADRLVRSPGIGHGAVVDWVAIDPYPRVFNLADVALRGGVVVLLIQMTRTTRPIRDRQDRA